MKSGILLGGITVMVAAFSRDKYEKYLHFFHYFITHYEYVPVTSEESEAATYSRQTNPINRTSSRTY